MKPYETFDIDLAKAKLREDALAHDLGMSIASVELKTDYLAADTGNIAVEFEVKTARGIEPSGLTITTASTHAFEIPGRCKVLIPTHLVKALTRRAIQQQLTKWIGDGGNHHCALIPWHWLLTWPGGQESTD